MGVRRRSLLAAALALSLTGAAAFAQNAPDQQVPLDETQTGLVGHVVLATRCPVPVGDDDGVCPSPPFATTLSVRAADDTTEVGRVATDTLGAFSIRLDPGTYVVEVAASSPQRVPVIVAPDGPTPLTIHVVAGAGRVP
jgi:hypothetical protein